MLILKMIKYRKSPDGQITEEIEQQFIRESQSTHMTYEPNNVRILQIGDATAGETTTYKLGNRSDCQFDVAYLMNEDGSTLCKL